MAPIRPGMVAPARDLTRGDCADHPQFKYSECVSGGSAHDTCFVAIRLRIEFLSLAAL